MTGNNNPMDVNSSGQPQLNPGVEVRNDIDDYRYRQDVQRMHSSLDLIVTKGNIAYDQTLNTIIRQNIEEQQKSGVSMSLRQMIPNVENAVQSTALSLVDRMNAGYGSENDLTQALKEAFASLTDINVADYINKSNLTYEDQEILNRYNEFCDEVLSRMQKEFANRPEYQNDPYEMALYALHVYNDEGGSAYETWCTPLRDTSVIPTVSERGSAQLILDFLEKNYNTADFQADFYYDKDKDKYVLAFRGSEPGVDFWHDGVFLTTGRSAQHDIAASLGQLIADSGLPIDKLTITGHSLGGGLALLAGAITGAETYVYDPLHLTNKTIQHYNLDISGQENFHCYQEKNEGLVSLGEKAALALNINNELAKAGLTGNYFSAADKLLLGNKLSGDDKNILNKPVELGSTIIVEIPNKDDKLPAITPAMMENRLGEIATGLFIKDDKSSVLNHSQLEMVKGLSATDWNRSSEYIHGRNMRQALARMRAEKPYRQGTSGIMISTGGLQFQVVERN